MHRVKGVRGDQVGQVGVWGQEQDEVRLVIVEHTECEEEGVLGGRGDV